MEPIGFKTQSNYKNNNECWDASILWAKQIERQNCFTDLSFITSEYRKITFPLLFDCVISRL
jgi:hypothetical protein